jgi:hypothetical protein
VDVVSRANPFDGHKSFSKLHVSKRERRTKACKIMLKWKRILCPKVYDIIRLLYFLYLASSAEEFPSLTLSFVTIIFSHLTSTESKSGSE